MKRSPSSRRGRVSREVEKLIQLSEGIAESGSKAEDSFWVKKLEEEIEGRFIESDEVSLNTALDKLADKESRAHEELADTIEGCVEHQKLNECDEQVDTLLFAVPILAWSRLGLDTKFLTNAQLDKLRKILKTHVFNSQADLSLANFLYSPDQCQRLL